MLTLVGRVFLLLVVLLSVHTIGFSLLAVLEGVGADTVAVSPGVAPLSIPRLRIKLPSPDACLSNL